MAGLSSALSNARQECRAAFLEFSLRRGKATLCCTLLQRRNLESSNKESFEDTMISKISRPNRSRCKLANLRYVAAIISVPKDGNSSFISRGSRFENKG